MARTKARARAGRRGEAEFLRDYRKRDHPRPSVTVDLVIFTVLDTDLKVLLIQRDEPPYRGYWALPGGFVRVGDAFDDQGEDVEAAAHRELLEETGLAMGNVYLEQLFTFGAADRDPRMRIISVAYYALVRPDLAPTIEAGGDAKDVRWFSVADQARDVRLAFDHGDILSKGVERIRGKIDYTPIAFELVPPTFTIGELREVYEAIKGTTYDPGNFRRRFKRMQTDGIIQQAPGKRLTASKPAFVYRFKRKRRPANRR